MADKSGVYKYYNGKDYDNIYFKTKGPLVEEDATHRFMTDIERNKLKGIAEGANKYIHPSTHPASMVTEDANHKFMTDTERNKLKAIAERANNYVHPSTHPASMITEDANHKFVKDSDKLAWNAKASKDIAKTNSDGLMSYQDKQKLDGIEKIIKSVVLSTFYPVGSIYMSITNKNPKELFGGEWAQWGAGRVPVGVGTGVDSQKNKVTFNSPDSIGGEYFHKLIVDEIPKHRHGLKMSVGRDYVIPNGEGSGVAYGDTGNCRGHWFTASVVADETGGSKYHNNIQPYITCYMWKRVG